MKTLAHALKRMLRRVGVDVARFQPRTHPLAKKIDLWRRLEIDLILDVGANTGQFAAEVCAHGYRGRIVSFEPLSSAYSDLAQRCADDPLWTARNYALGDADGEQTINVSANSWSSSLLPASEAGISAAPDARAIAVEKIAVRRLDSVLPELDAANAQVWLKIDTQGYEMHVLNGAPQTLPRVKMLQLEMSFVPLYVGQPLFDEIYRWVYDRGFRLGSIELPCWHPQTGELLWLDAVFHRLMAPPQEASPAS